MAKFYPSNLYNTEHKWHNFGRQSCSQCLGLWSSPVSWWYLQLRLRISYSYDIWYKASGVFWQLLHEWSYHTWTSKSITRRPHPISFSDPVCECVQTFSCSKIQLHVSKCTHIHVWFHSFESWLDIIDPIQNREWILSSQPKSVVAHDCSRGEGWSKPLWWQDGQEPVDFGLRGWGWQCLSAVIRFKSPHRWREAFLTLAGWWGFEGWEDIPPSSPKKEDRS